MTSHLIMPFDANCILKIAYELNPPKIVKGERFDPVELAKDMIAMAERAKQLAPFVSGIHLTDSVLGVPRVSGITAAGYIMKKSPSAARLSCSIRVRDRNFTSLCQAVADATMTGVDSLLVLLGDEPENGPASSGLKPSAAIKMLKNEGYDSKIRLDLSFPASVREAKPAAIKSKLDACPHSLVTQSISSLSDLGGIVDLAKPHGVKVAACIMVPSEKNRQSASIIGLDWSAYEKNPVDFVHQAAKIADRVLLTSPNSFQSGLDLLKQLR
jgi:5,10-methylenetetrahydrofolate reductase